MDKPLSQNLNRITDMAISGYGLLLRAHVQSGLRLAPVHAKVKYNQSYLKAKL